MGAAQVYHEVTGRPECLTGQCPGVPGAISEGKTLAELKANMTEAIELVLEKSAGIF